MDFELNFERLKELVQALTPIADMAVLLDVPESLLRAELADPTSKAYYVYRRAKAEVSLMMRIEIIKMAQAGAPTAIAELQKMNAKLSVDEP